MPGNLTEVVTALTSTTVPAGQLFSFSARASNIGNASTGAASTSRIFLSLDTVFDGNDTTLAIQTVPQLGAFSEFVQNYAVDLPANLAPGTYYVGGVADFEHQIGESNEGDNNNNFLTLTITPALHSNLTETVTALSSTTVAAGGTFSYSTTASNSGSVRAESGSTGAIFLSDDPIITLQDMPIALDIAPALLPGQTSSHNVQLQIPSNLAPGTYYIGGLADVYNQVNESNEGDNNGNYLTITVTAPPPPPAANLTETVTALTSTTVTPGGFFSYATTASNSGNAQAGSGSTGAIFLSNDLIITTQDRPLSLDIAPALLPGQTSSHNAQVQLPGDLAPGTYYIGGLADVYNQVTESNEGDNNNNVVTLTVLPSNLTETVTALSSTTMASGGSFSFQARAANSGTGNSFGSTSGIYLSDDANITTSDVLLTPQSVPILTPNAIVSQDFALNLPNLRPGTYYIGGLADVYGQVPESNELDNNNNVIAITITGSNEVSASTTSEGGRCVALTMDEANSQLSHGIASTFGETAGDPAMIAPGACEAAASAPPLVASPEQLKHV